jgi:hypothetical protein
MDKHTFQIIKDSSDKNKTSEPVMWSAGRSAILVKESVFHAALGAAQKVLDRRDPIIESFFATRSVK